jgi:hypothetical protein
LPEIAHREIANSLVLSGLITRELESGLRHQGSEVHMIWTKQKYVLGGSAALLAAALTVAGAAQIRHRIEANRVVPITVPGDTSIHVTLNQAVSSDLSRPGDHFTATISQPIILDDRTVIPEGAEVEGIVVDARRSGRLKGRAHLNLALESVNVNGVDYAIRTTSTVRVGGKHKKRNIAWIAGGAGGGALIGGLAAGGEGALIGGPIGAGAGTAVAFFTGRKDIHLRAETPLSFKLAEPVTIDTKNTKA